MVNVTAEEQSPIYLKPGKSCQSVSSNGAFQNGSLRCANVGQAVLTKVRPWCNSNISKHFNISIQALPATRVRPRGADIWGLKIKKKCPQQSDQFLLRFILCVCLIDWMYWHNRSRVTKSEKDFFCILLQCKHFQFIIKVVWVEEHFPQHPELPLHGNLCTLNKSIWLAAPSYSIEIWGEGPDRLVPGVEMPLSQ